MPSSPTGPCIRVTTRNISFHQHACPQTHQHTSRQACLACQRVRNHVSCMLNISWTTTLCMYSPTGPYIRVTTRNIDFHQHACPQTHQHTSRQACLARRRVRNHASCMLNISWKTTHSVPSSPTGPCIRVTTRNNDFHQHDCPQTHQHTSIQACLACQRVRNHVSCMSNISWTTTLCMYSPTGPYIRVTTRNIDFHQHACPQTPCFGHEH